MNPLSLGSGQLQALVWRLEATRQQAKAQVEESQRARMRRQLRGL